MAEVDVTRIAGNIGAMNALNALKGINNKLSVHQTRLSTGKRINSAADDPAGLSIATKMLSRSEGLKVALDNIGDAKNLLAVAESGMGRINDILVQMRNKAETAASDTMSGTERTAIKRQLEAYSAQIDDIAAQTKWNDTVLLNGSMTSMRLQTGVDSTDKTMLDDLGNMTSTGAVIGIATTAATSTATSSAAAIVDAETPLTAAFNGMNTLNTAAYQLVYSYDATADSLTFQLKDSNGAIKEIDADGTNQAGSNVTATSRTVTWTAAADLDGVDLGNGLQVSFKSASFAANASGSATMTFTKAGTGVLSLGTEDAQGYADFMDIVSTAINNVNGKMAALGAITGRLTFKEDQVSASQINIEAAYNRIMNADMAQEQVEASKYQILQRTATAMLAQANAAPQFLLSLFQ